MEKDTVSMHFVRGAVQKLAAPLRERVLDAARIPRDLVEASQARVTAQSFAALWLAIARELDDEFFGLDARRMKVGSFAMLARVAATGKTLERALRLVLRGFALFLDDLQGELEIDGAHAVIRLSNRIADPEARRYADETWLVMVHGLMCWLAGQRVPLLQAEFAHPRPAHAGEYAVMYGPVLRFERPCTAVRFDARALAAPLALTPAGLKAFLRAAPQSVFLKYKNDASWTVRTKRRLRRELSAGELPSFARVAGEFNMAPTTLRRKLLAEGASFQEIKDALRRDAAIHYLCNSTLSIADIGGRLGFHEVSAFHRAFKKWSGVQPGRYRLDPPAPA